MIREPTTAIAIDTAAHVAMLIDSHREHAHHQRARRRAGNDNRARQDGIGGRQQPREEADRGIEIGEQLQTRHGSAHERVDRAADDCRRYLETPQRLQRERHAPRDEPHAAEEEGCGEVIEVARLQQHR
jgi:hypothetical protein